VHKKGGKVKNSLLSLQSSAVLREISGYNTENQKLKTDSSCFPPGVL
jgi:hypothetical protein